jgi:hypothetical protein
MIPTRSGTYGLALNGTIQNQTINAEIPLDLVESTQKLNFPDSGGSSAAGEMGGTSGNAAGPASTTIIGSQLQNSKVQELASQGYNQSEISKILQISQPTINRDITYLRQQAKTNIKKYIDERLLKEYEKCLVGLRE